MSHHQSKVIQGYGESTITGEDGIYAKLRDSYDYNIHLIRDAAMVFASAVKYAVEETHPEDVRVEFDNTPGD